MTPEPPVAGRAAEPTAEPGTAPGTEPRARPTALDRVHSFGLGLAAATLLLITVIVLAGIVSRSLFGRPIPSSNELIGSCLLLVVIYPAMSSANHIRISFLVRRLPPRVRAGVERAMVAVSVVTVAIAAYAAAEATVVSFTYREYTLGLWNFEIYPFRFLIFAGLVALGLRAATGGRRWLSEAGASE